MLICITLSSIQVFTEVGVLGVPTSPSSPNSQNSISSSEFDTIDSFDVHPANRWIESGAGTTVTVDNGWLNITDVGDGNLDTYTIIRGLRSLDGNLEMRFKVDSNTSSQDGNNQFIFRLQSADGSSWINFNAHSVNDATAFPTRLRYIDINGATQTLDYITAEKLFDDIWYTLRIDYDILKSNFRIRIYTDDGIKKSDYIWEDVEAESPALFGATDLALEADVWVYTAKHHNSYYIDYVKAPFKEREWDHYDESGDSDWLFASVTGHSIEKTISDTDGFRITIPQLDQWKGELFIDSIQDANWDSNDGVNFSATLYAVDSDDGDLHNIFTVILELDASAANQIVIETHVIVDDTVFGEVVSSAPAYGEYGYVEFSMVLLEDRSQATLEIQADSGEGDGVSTIFNYEVDLSAVSSDSSQEFVLSLDADVEISNANLECVLSVFSNFILERGESSGRDSPMVPKNTLPDGGGDSLFGWLGDLFKNAIAVLALILSPFLIIIDETLKKFNIDVGGFITNAINDIQGFFDIIGGFVQGIFDDFVNGARDLLEALLDGLIVLVQSVVDFVIAFIFLMWDFIGLPDVLAIAAVGFEVIVEILLGTPQFILDVINDWILPFAIIIICLYWLWLVFLSFAEEGFEPFAGFSNFIERLMAVYNLTIAGVGPLPIPIALFFIPLTYFLIIVPSGSIFAIW